MSTVWEVPPHIVTAAARVSTRLPVDLVEQALVRYEAGVTLAVIRRELMVGERTVKLWRLKSQLPVRAHTSIGVSLLPPAEQERRRKVIAECGSVNAAEDALGLAHGTLWKWAHRTCPDAMPTRRKTITRPAQGGPNLPVEPLALWLDAQLQMGAVVEDMADAAGLSARRLNAVQRREYPTVSTHVADRLLTGNGWTLALVYPDVPAAA